MNQYKNPNYTWDDWFSHPKFKLERGKHFPCQSHGMSIMVRQAAYKRGLKVSVHIHEETLIVEVKGPNDKEDRGKEEV